VGWFLLSHSLSLSLSVCPCRHTHTHTHTVNLSHIHTIFSLIPQSVPRLCVSQLPAVRLVINQRRVNYLEISLQTHKNTHTHTHTHTHTRTHTQHSLTLTRPLTQ